MIRKPYITLLGLLAVCSSLYAQRPVPSAYPSSYKLNLVRVREVKKPILDPAVADATVNVLEVAVNSQYYDGLGRVVQTVGKQSTPTFKDVVAAIEYDAYGREQYSYLPFSSTVSSTGDVTNDGKFKANPFQQQAAFYNAFLSGQGQTYYYGIKTFERSPMNRVSESYAAGNNWAGTASQALEANRRSVDMRYSLNSLGDNVQHWTVTDGAVGTFGSYTATSYSAGVLTKIVTEDEQEGQTIEFKDKDGKVVLRKVRLTANKDMGPTSHGHTGWLSTYYMYDKLGNLRCVLQPQGRDVIASSMGWALTDPAVLSEYCFRYAYDERNRMIMKQVPGGGVSEMVYDQRDRLIMSRDARLTSMGFWNVFKYDNLNRQIKIGLIANSASRATHQTNSSADINCPVLNPADVMQENYYDNYQWITSPTPQTGISSTFFAGDVNSSFFITSYNQAPHYAQQITPDYVNVKGRQTGSKVRVLGISTYLHSVIFYDSEGRVIQTRGANITNGFDIVTTQYDFSGKVLRTVHRHDKQGTMARFVKVNTIYDYDHMGRVLTIKKKIGTTERTIVSNTYDELGRVKTRNVGGLEDQTIDYNIRGWQLGMNREFLVNENAGYFGYELAYDQVNTYVPGSTYGNRRYDGNICATTWRSAGDKERRLYAFKYDAASRLTSADFVQFNGSFFDKSAGIDFSVPTLQYDLNGNIQKMTQKGWKLNSSTIIDSLEYEYLPNSNKLAKVTDKANDVNSTLGDFKEPTSTTGDDYTYDPNGNLTSDKNKGITSILYTHLNMPYEINIAGKGKVIYQYDNLGNKLKKTVVDNTVTPARTTTWMYIHNFVYKNDTMQFFTHEEGRARYDVSEGTGEAKKFDFDYFLKDQLGNVRMVLTEEKDTSFYPAATIEDATRPQETLFYNIVTAQVKDKAQIANVGSISSFGSKLYKVHGGLAGQKTGLGIVLKVMAGDTVAIHAESFYNLPGGDAGGPLSIALTELLSAFTGSGALSAKGLSPTTVAGIGGNTTSLTNFLNTSTGSTTADAHLNWVLFDDQFKYVNGDVDPVKNGGGYKSHTKFINTPALINKSGYLYIFVSNKSNLEVFFDNLVVTHRHGPILDETHYYPFGLTMAGISSRALGSTDNKIKFQAQEFASKEFNDGSGLDMYEFKWRMHDPQIGRFWQVDPLSEKFVHNSTYAFSENKVINHVELEGLEAMPITLFGNNTVIARSPILEGAVEVGGKVGKTSGELPKTQDHHLIPRQFKGDQVVDAARRSGFKFEGAENKIELQQFSKQTGEGRHGGAHPNYNNEFGKRLADFKEKNPNATPEQMTNFVKNTAKELRETIQNNPGTKVNDLFKADSPVPVKDAVNAGLPVIVPDKVGPKPDPPSKNSERIFM